MNVEKLRKKIGEFFGLKAFWDNERQAFRVYSPTGICIVTVGTIQRDNGGYSLFGVGDGISTTELYNYVEG